MRMRFGQWDNLVSLLVGAAYRVTKDISIGVSGELAAACTASVASCASWHSTVTHALAATLRLFVMG